MIIADELNQRQSKSSIEKVAFDVSRHPEHLAELWHLIGKSAGMPTDQASWAWYKIAKVQADLLNPFVPQMLQRLSLGNCSDAVRRNLLGALQYVTIENEEAETLLDIAFRFVEDSTEPAAVRALSMGILGNLMPAFPELKHELRLILEDLLSRPQSAAIRARAKNTLKKLN